MYHTVWHVFVMVASMLHWFAVFNYTVHYEVPKPSLLSEEVVASVAAAAAAAASCPL